MIKVAQDYDPEIEAVLRHTETTIAHKSNKPPALITSPLTLALSLRRGTRGSNSSP